MKPDQPDYHSYLLRLWLVPDGGEGQWRASLEDFQTGDQQGFKDLPALLGFLASLTHLHDVQQVTLESPAPDEQLD